jgi:hypothetical protein
MRMVSKESNWEEGACSRKIEEGITERRCI